MILVYLSPVRWDSIAQRPHFFVKTALNSGFKSVIWIEPTASRLPKLADLKTKVRSVEARSFEKPANVHIVNSHFLPIEPLGKIYDIVNCKAIESVLESVKKIISGKRSVLVIGKPSRLAISLLDNLTFDDTVFDVMDDYSHFSKGISSKNISRNFNAIISRVNRCFFSSNNLMNKYGGLCDSSHLILNACDQEFYQRCLMMQKDKCRDHRVFGYVGSIAQWFDWDVIIKLALDNPQDKVILIGPNYEVSIPNLPANIELKKAVSHDKIPEIMSSFDFGLIPFKINELTQSVDPVKYYEYVACGLTVISTHFGEMTLRIEKGEVSDFDNYINFKPPLKSSPPQWHERFSSIIEELTHV
jgi:teichuronic acid biosynthesis glycosyltransferase TuaH